MRLINVFRSGFVAVAMVLISSSVWAADFASTTGFEDAGLWSGIESTSDIHSEGAVSGILTVNNWTETTSAMLSTVGIVGTHAAFDIMLPAVTNDWGEARLIVKIPSIGLHYQELGSQSVIGLSAGTFHTLTFEIPAALAAQFETSYTDLTFTVVVNAPAGTYLLDNLTLLSDGSVDTSADTDTYVIEDTDPTVDTDVDTGIDTEFVMSDQAIYLPNDLLPQQVAIGGNEFVKINDRTDVQNYYGYVTSAGLSGMNLGVDSKTRNVISEGVPFLRDRAAVIGNLTTGAYVDGQTDYVVTGTTTEYADLSPYNELYMPEPLFSAVDGDVYVGAEADEFITPGSYGAVSVNPLSELILSAGTYEFTSLIVEPQGTIVIDDSDGPVVVLVRDAFLFRGAVTNYAETFPVAPI